MSTTDDRDIDYDEFLELVKEGQIQEVQITENDLYALTVDTEINAEAFPTEYDYYTYLPDPAQFDSDIQAITGATNTTEYGFDVTYAPVRRGVHLRDAAAVLDSDHID